MDTETYETFEDWFANAYPETYADYRAEWLESQGLLCPGCDGELDEDGCCETPGCDQGN